MKVTRALTILAVSLVLTGCPKRQVGTRLIYTPAPPPAAAPPAQGGVLVIQPPAPPMPAESAPKPQEAVDSTPTQKPIHRRRAVHDETPDATAHGNTDEAAGAATEAPAASPPQLAPASSAQQQVELEKRVGELKGAIQQRIERLSHKNLSTADRKALQDARLFLSQADQATQQGDLQQSLNLAQKADLLIAAVEKRY
ncbi:MAG: hypothetical protein ACRD18_00685 [Terriglobia bacterium]